MMLMRCRLPSLGPWAGVQKQLVAPLVIVMPRSCSCSIQSIVAAPCWSAGEFVVVARVEQEAPGGGGLPGGEVGDAAAVAAALEGDFTGHCGCLSVSGRVTDGAPSGLRLPAIWEALCTGRGSG